MLCGCANQGSMEKWSEKWHRTLSILYASWIITSWRPICVRPAKAVQKLLLQRDWDDDDDDGGGGGGDDDDDDDDCGGGGGDDDDINGYQWLFMVIN